jgi:hypothetical protein
MPHVQLSTGIGKHGKAVKLLSLIVYLNGITIALQPMMLQIAFK